MTREMMKGGDGQISILVAAFELSRVARSPRAAEYGT